MCCQVRYQKSMITCDYMITVHLKVLSRTSRKWKKDRQENLEHSMTSSFEVGNERIVINVSSGLKQPSLHPTFLFGKMRWNDPVGDPITIDPTVTTVSGNHTKDFRQAKHQHGHDVDAAAGAPWGRSEFAAATRHGSSGVFFITYL